MSMGGGDRHGKEAQEVLTATGAASKGAVPTDATVAALERHAAFRARVKGTPPPSHGTTYAYNVYGCRCQDCREAMQAKNAGRVYVPRPKKPHTVPTPRTAKVRVPPVSWWVGHEDDFGAAAAAMFA